MGGQVQSRKNPRADAAFLWVLVALGALPFLGFVVVGTWSQVELGIGALLLLFAVHGLVQEYRSRSRS